MVGLAFTEPAASGQSGNVDGSVHSGRAPSKEPSEPRGPTNNKSVGNGHISGHGTQRACQTRPLRPSQIPSVLRTATGPPFRRPGKGGTNVKLRPVAIPSSGDAQALAACSAACPSRGRSDPRDE